MIDNQPIASRLILILGGARSGKSFFAERLARESGRSVAYIATATAGDDEMRERIARHRAARPAAWHTIEEPLDLAAAVLRAGELADVLLLDCMTLWLSNLFMREIGEPEKRDEGDEGKQELLTDGSLFDQVALLEVQRLLAAAQSLAPGKALLVISNEVGLGIVPEYAPGRLYRDTLGYVNQRLALAADKVYLMIAGMGVDIKRLQDDDTSIFLP